MADKIEIFSLNARGLGQPTKRHKIFTWLQKQDMGLIMLQETHSTEDVEKQWRTEWGGEVYFSHGTSRARGVAILFKPSINNLEVHSCETDEEGRLVVLDVTINDIRTTVANVYGPNDDNPEFFRNIMGKIENMPNDNRILGGDFNLVLQLDVDKQGGRYATHRQAQEVLLNWMADEDLIDVWRAQHRLRKQFTYHTTYPADISVRLDFFLVSFGLLANVHRTSITHGYLTDHASIRMILKTTSQPRGPGFWKLNTSLLKEADYIRQIKEVIVNTVQDNRGADPALMWETIKLQCRGKSIQYGSRKKRKRKNKIKSLEKEINDLLIIIQENPDRHQDTQARLDEVKTELDREVEEETKGHIIRSKARWCEEGEKPNKYFLNLEKRNYNQKTITKLKLENGSCITDKQDILDKQYNFYSKLYSSTNVDNALERDSDFFVLDGPKLSQEQLDDCEGDIVESELFAALKSTQNNKSPGSDGLPCEFYKIFWQDIKHYLLAAVNHAYNTGELSISQKQGIISLLPKKGRDTLLLKNWRPISLLNQDYKLIAKALAARMKKHLTNIIHSDQTGFINDRYIGENITRILNIMEYAEEEHTAAVIMSIDYEKAYDSVEWKYMYKVLKFFNFGPQLIKWISILYTNITSCVVNNGWTTQFFKLARGVRQGCPLSPYLFVLSAELLSIAIRHNDKIEGVTIGEKTHKIVQFADDTALTLLCKRDTLHETYKLLHRFRCISGLKINLEKTKVLRIGAIKDSDIVLLPEYGVEWTGTSLSILGTVLPNDRSKISELNYEPKLKKIENIIAIWRQRNLTLYGKTQIIKTYLISQIIYLMSVLPAPSLDFITKLDRILFKFLWKNKTERIKRNTLWRTIEEGGVGMPHIPSFNYALKLSWLKRLLQPENVGSWKSLILRCLPIKEEFMWKCNLNKRDLEVLFNTVKNDFWKGVLEAWAVYNFHDPTTAGQIKDQTLWFNSHIRIQNRVVFYQIWYEEGIKAVGDIMNNDGSIMTYEQFQVKYPNLRSNYLVYYGIKTAIPAHWKQKLLVQRGQIAENRKNVVEQLLAMVKVCKQTYKHFVDILTDKSVQVTGIKKWESIFNSDYSDCYLDIFNGIYKCTKDTTLRAFQFHIVHRSLVTNVDLCKWRIKEYDTCTFCKEVPETIQHMLWECPVSARMWTSILDWLGVHTRSNIRFTTEDILLGCRQDAEWVVLYNLIFLVAKRHAYVSRCKNCQPTFDKFLYKLRGVFSVEQECAHMYNTVPCFARKWQPLMDIMVD